MSGGIDRDCVLVEVGCSDGFIGYLPLIGDGCVVWVIDKCFECSALHVV